MLKPAVSKALSDQSNAEFYSSYLYLAMAAHFERESLPGIAHWMRLQAGEEYKHGLKFFEQILVRGGTPVLGAIEAPPASFGTHRCQQASFQYWFSFHASVETCNFPPSGWKAVP